MKRSKLNNCTCKPATLDKPDEFSGRTNSYYDVGCLVHDEVAFRNEVINYLRGIRSRQRI